VSAPRSGESNICDVCDKSPAQDTPWAEYEWTSPKTHAPTGPACAACDDIHKRHFKYLTWQQFAAHARSDAGNLEAVKKPRSGSEAWNAQGVFKETATELIASRSLMLMNAQKYTRLLKKALPGGARANKSQTFMIPSEANPDVLERVWAFQHPTMPFRVAEFRTVFRDSRSEVVLGPEASRFESQGDIAFSAARAKTDAVVFDKNDSGERSSNRFQGVPPLLDHVAKINPDAVDEVRDMLGIPRQESFGVHSDSVGQHAQGATHPSPSPNKMQRLPPHGFAVDAVRPVRV